jgi:hypothetical protein
MAAVIAGIIILVGYKAISQIINTGNRASFDTFMTDIESDVQTYARQYGSQKKLEFTISSSFDEICFLDSMENDKFLFNQEIIGNPFIKDSVKSGVKLNVFMMNNKKIEESFYVDSLDVKTDFLCLPNEGKIEILLKGTGKKAELYTK